ncbi:uroporphyrinogen-III synthase [Qipengyuania proteolytica]|uniref:uroporphyrinogen-III synthase n=1 Tax=Qipengyuania proteolytica TaxID=2867239 RepID=UPI0031E4E992
MKPLFLLRPEPGWSISAETGRAMGLDVFGGPLFEVEPAQWEAPDPDGFEGLLVGSANVFRHGGDGLEAFSRLPVHVVGQATADAARNAGFVVGQVGRGGLQSVLDALDGRELHLLRLAGEDHVILAAPEGIRIETRVVYRTVPIELADAERLRAGGVVALHSGAAATRFAEECDRLGLERALIDLAVIGPRVAEMAGTGWRSIHIAEAAEDTQLLALAKALCQDSPQRDG